MRSIRSFLKKTFPALALAFCLLFSLAACTVEHEPPVFDTRLNLLTTDGYSIYSIIRADFGCPGEVIEASTGLREKMQTALGTTVALTTDFVERDIDASLRYEILVGATNRAESTEEIAKLGHDEYVICVRGHKIVIAGESARATVCAVEVFLEEILRYSDGMAPLGTDAKIPSDYRKTGVYVHPTILNEVTDSMLKCAKYQATTLLQVALPTNAADALTLGTLQGLAANLSSEQILIKAGAYAQYTQYLKTEYGVNIRAQNDKGRDWNLELLLQNYARDLKGYILCDEDLTRESAAVAVSLAGKLGAVVMTPENEKKGKDAGLVCLLDVRGKDDAWLRASEYFATFPKDIAVEQPMDMAPKLVDYVVMSGCYCYFYNGTDGYTHDQKFKFLDDGATVLGWNNVLGEFETVSSFARQNAQLIPADHAINLSTVSGFAKASMVQKDAAKPSDGTVTGKHTVCFIMSDGDNLQWAIDGYGTNKKWFASLLRGTFPIGWGLPASMIDLFSPMMSYFYDKATPNDEFMLQLSGLGYTYPSLWSPTARREMAVKVADTMKRMDVKYLEVLDTDAFNTDVLSCFGGQDGIEGVFYIDYANYAGEGGKILWADGTPIVSARYRLWSDMEDGQPEAIAEAINAASTDPSSEDAYSFIIVHAWSGLDDEGKLISGGATMEAVRDLISRFDGDVEVVSVSEFMTRIGKNLKK